MTKPGNVSVDAVLAAWRHGDSVVGENWFVHRVAPENPLTAEATAAAKEDVDVAEVQVSGLVWSLTGAAPVARDSGARHTRMHSERVRFCSVLVEERTRAIMCANRVVGRPEDHPIARPSSHQRPMKDYRINIFYSDEDEGYIADIPNLEACSAFGNTAEDALREVEVAREAWIETAKAEGKPIPVPAYRPPIYQFAP